MSVKGTDASGQAKEVALKPEIISIPSRFGHSCFRRELNRVDTQELSFPCKAFNFVVVVLFHLLLGIRVFALVPLLVAIGLSVLSWSVKGAPSYLARPYLPQDDMHCCSDIVNNTACFFLGSTPVVDCVSNFNASCFYGTWSNCLQRTCFTQKMVIIPIFALIFWILFVPCGIAIIKRMSVSGGCCESTLCGRWVAACSTHFLSEDFRQTQDGWVFIESTATCESGMTGIWAHLSSRVPLHKKLKTGELRTRILILLIVIWVSVAVLLFAAVFVVGAIISSAQLSNCSADPIGLMLALAPFSIAPLDPLCATEMVSFFGGTEGDLQELILDGTLQGMLVSWPNLGAAEIWIFVGMISLVFVLEITDAFAVCVDKCFCDTEFHDKYSKFRSATEPELGIVMSLHQQENPIYEFRLKCPVAVSCRQFLLKHGFSDSVFDHRHSHCYCKICGDHHKKLVVSGNRHSTYPLGWVKFGIRCADPRLDDIMNDWNIAYHGTICDTSVKIVRNGGLLKALDVPPDSDEPLPIRPGHIDYEIFDKTLQPELRKLAKKFVTSFFVSPSLKYAQQYAYPGTVHDGKSFLVVFRLRILPGTFKDKLPVELFEPDQLHTLPAFDGDDLFPGECLEWFTQRNQVIVLTGLLVKGIDL